MCFAIHQGIFYLTLRNNKRDYVRHTEIKYELSVDGFTKLLRTQIAHYDVFNTGIIIFNH